VNDNQSNISISSHYELEVYLARKLREASKEERLQLYSEVYDQLFNSIADHPQSTRPNNGHILDGNIRYQLNLLKPILAKDKKFLEIGFGDGRLLVAVSRFVCQSVGLETSMVIANHLPLPDNTSIQDYDGVNMPFSAACFDVVYSHQLLEHLHPEDARDHISAVYNLLNSGGRYLCVTPNRFYGPHDVSRGFTKIATGLHLCEYSYYDLYRLFLEAGYTRIKFVFMMGNLRISVHPFFLVIYDSWCLCFPGYSFKQLLSRYFGNLCLEAAK